jgi:hypothetical protein
LSVRAKVACTKVIIIARNRRILTLPANTKISSAAIVIRAIHVSTRVTATRYINIQAQAIAAVISGTKIPVITI